MSKAEEYLDKAEKSISDSCSRTQSLLSIASSLIELNNRLSRLDPFLDKLEEEIEIGAHEKNVV